MAILIAILLAWLCYKFFRSLAQVFIPAIFILLLIYMFRTLWWFFTIILIITLIGWAVILRKDKKQIK